LAQTNPSTKKRTLPLCWNDSNIGFAESGYQDLFTSGGGIQQLRMAPQ
jgi:hypothetical protein